jgi:hypothetical protein
MSSLMGCVYLRAAKMDRMVQVMSSSPSCRWQQERDVAIVPKHHAQAAQLLVMHAPVKQGQDL